MDKQIKMILTEKKNQSSKRIKRKGNIVPLKHNIVDVSVQNKKHYIEDEITKAKKIDGALDVIIVSPQFQKFNSIISKTKSRRKDSLSYSCDKDEVIGAIRALEIIIASRSFMFKEIGTNNFVEFNFKSKDKISTILVFFDLEGNSLWSNENKDIFLRISKMIEVAHQFGIYFNFLNLELSVERLNLEFYSNPLDFAC